MVLGNSNSSRCCASVNACSARACRHPSHVARDFAGFVCGSALSSPRVAGPRVFRLEPRVRCPRITALLPAPAASPSRISQQETVRSRTAISAVASRFPFLRDFMPLEGFDDCQFAVFLRPLRGRASAPRDCRFTGSLLSTPRGLAAQTAAGREDRRLLSVIRRIGYRILVPSNLYPAQFAAPC